MANPPSIQSPIAPRIRQLAGYLENAGDKLVVAEANRLAEAVAFLEAEVARHRAKVVGRCRAMHEVPQPDLFAA